MPTYTYSCKKCGHSFDVFHSISATPKVKCEACNSAQTQRNIGTGSGIIFKGSGFYETDYKGKKGGGSDTKSDAKPEPKAESKSDAKSETKAETKKDSASPKGTAAGGKASKN